MKLKLFLTIVVSLLVDSIIYSQNDLKDTLKYKIVYDFSYQENKEDTLNKKSEQMVLKVAENFSFYISYNNMALQDLLLGSKKTHEIPNMQSTPRTRLLYTILKDYKNDRTIFSDRIGVDNYSFTSSLDNFDWKLYNEQKTIMGYQCKKATTKFAGRDYIAWYSTEISISDGPYKFRGLPGLIFSIYDTNNHYRFDISSIDTDNNYFSTESLFSKPIQINNEEYKTLKRKYREKPSSMVNSGAITFPKEFLELADKKAKERLIYENNPLELTD